LNLNIENNLGSESGDQVGSFDEETRGQKLHASVPLRHQASTTSPFFTLR
jgi:hypothetical protein